MDKEVQSGRMWQIVSACILVLVSVFCMVRFSPEKIPVDGLRELSVNHWYVDAKHTYAPQIEGKEVEDWHSALLMYEGRAVRHVAAFVTGEPCSGQTVLLLIWGACGMVICYGAIYLQNRLLRNGRCYAWMLVPLSATLYLINCTGVCLDYYFIGATVAGMLVLSALFSTDKLWQKWLYVALLCVVLLHMAEYRKNSAFVLVVMVYAAMMALRLLQGRRWWRLLVAIILAFVLYCVATQAVSWVLPVQKTLPTLPMMESDMRSAAVLENRVAEEQAEWEKLGWRYGDCWQRVPKVKDDYTADRIGAFFRAAGGLDAEDYGAFRVYYLHSWTSRFQEMFIARMLTVLHFYWGSPVEWLRPHVENIYPHLKSNPCWMDGYTRVGLHPVVRMVRVPLLLLSACSLSVYLFRRWRRYSILSPSAHIVALLNAIGVSYAVSYLVVTPSTDLRYLQMSMAFAFLSTALIAMDCIYARFICPGVAGKARNSSRQ